MRTVVLLLLLAAALAAVHALGPGAPQRRVPGRPVPLETAKDEYRAARAAKHGAAAPHHPPPGPHPSDGDLDAMRPTLDAFGDTPDGSVYTRLRRTVDEAARRLDDGDALAVHFGALLHPNVDYVHQGRGHWHGLARVAETLVREQRDEHGMASGRLQSCETVAHDELLAVRELIELRRGGERQARRLDVYFLRLEPASGLVVLIERMPSLEDPYLVAGAAGAPAKRSAETQ